MNSKRIPALFVGHGSPMNIISSNSYTEDLAAEGEKLPVPAAYLVISAHWLTDGTFINTGESPEQIYDFYGFPEELYQVQYRAPGSVEISEIVIDTIGNDIITGDKSRGIDHAAWAILNFLNPAQNVPVLELSLDISKPPEYHYLLGEKLKPLREQNIMIIGSGNIVHNLMMINFNENAEPYPWAIEFDEYIKEKILMNDIEALVQYENTGSLAKTAFPTNEHYLPLLYTLALKDDSDSLEFFHQGIQNASISMRCLKIE